MPSIEEKITRYFANLSPSVLGLGNKGPIEILEMAPGSYNLNFHVRISPKDFIFRVNIEPQSGLDAQIEHEFKVLKFVEGHGIAPRAYHYDVSRRYFEFDILIEAYLAGPALPLEADYLPQVAELLTRLHSLDPAGKPFMTWPDPLADTHELIRGDLIGYEAVKNPDKETIRLARQVLAKSEEQLSKRRHLFQAERLNHTDLCCENFIITADGLRLIDWEKPRVDDVSYDLGCFLSGPAQLYNSRKVLNSEQRGRFIEAYAGLSGNNPDLLREKVNAREPMISLHWILWAATKLANLSDERTSPELVKAHEEKVARYQRVANPQNIERIIERFNLD
jgi:thiamine kinase-like enzyme